MSALQPWVVFAWELTAIPVAAITGRRKGRPWTGFWLGLILGWIGVIIIAVTRPTRDTLIQREKQRLDIQREARS